MSIWIFTGINGKGKTSLMQAIATKVAFNRGRNLKMQAHINELNRNGFKLTVPQHTVATNYSATFKMFGRTPRAPRIIDPRRLGFFAGDSGKKMHYIVPWQFFCIDEAQLYWPSKGETLDPSQENMFLHHRHFFLDFLMTTPDFVLIHKRIRQLAGGVEVVSKKCVYDKYGTCKIIWTLNVIKPGELNNYLESNPKDRKHYITRIKYVFDGDVHKTYNPTGHAYKFLEGHLNEDFDLNYELADPRSKEDYKRHIELFRKEEPLNNGKKKKS